MLDLDPTKIVRVVDFETTGLPDDENAEIIEIGFVNVMVDTNSLGRQFQRLVRPAKPITPKTMAIHHITNEDVADAELIGRVMPELVSGMGQNDVFAAHNAKMERHFYAGAGRRWICTYKCALHFWPDLESHNNQAVRYGLGIELDKERASPPHRALPDAYVTAHILLECLKRGTVDELVEITESPVLLKTIGFGKHRGRTFEDLAKSERGYLQWMKNQDFDEDVLFTVKHWLGR